MRSLVITIIIFFITNCLNAQVYLGLNTAFELPCNNYKEVDNGIGVNLLLGYSYKQRIDFNISAGNTWMNSLIDGYKINSVELSTNYYIISKAIRPYIGVSGGYYIKSIEVPFNESLLEKGIGIKPCIGLLFDLNLMKKLKVNSKFYFNKVFTDHQISLYGLNIGLLYYF
ncbi:MAG: hypothetical protein ACOCWG_02010 [bacterium]